MQHSEDLDNYGYVNPKCIPQYEMWKLQNKRLAQKQVIFERKLIKFQQSIIRSYTNITTQPSQNLYEHYMRSHYMASH